MSKKIRTRFAPSPTGELHVGGLRTALYNYLFAKANKGDFVLRIEDTDRERFVEGAKERLIDILEQFGITPDESINHGGKFGSYLQSERLNLYKKYVQELLGKGLAYYAFDTPEELEIMREEQQAAKQQPKYDRRALELSNEDIKTKLDAGEPHVVRMKIPEGETVFTDIIRGEIKINNNTIDDQIILKSDGYPTYHLAVVVDDHLMEISHVIRGEEWIPSTPKHIILYNMFDWDVPEFAHLPLLTNEQKAKLSKRHGDVSVEDFTAKGYLTEALLNFIALLGWNPGDDKEIFSLKELIKEFKLEKVHKGSAVFNREKLAWMNSQYIKNTDSDDLANIILPSLELESWFDKDLFKLNSVIDLFKERLDVATDIVAKAEFLYNLADYDTNILIFKKSDQDTAIKALELAQDIIESTEIKSADKLRDIFDDKREKLELSRAEVFWPLRVAVSGSEQSPDVFDIIILLQKEETLKRINIALAKLAKM